MPLGDILKAYCSSCSGDRNCEIQGEFRQEYSDNAYNERTFYRILQCRGCDSVGFQRIYTNSEDYEYYVDEVGEQQIEYLEKIEYYPPPLKRPPPDWFGEIGFQWGDASEVYSVVKEVYGALEHDLIILASIGTRTSFDVASKFLGVDTELSFSKKLDKLVELMHVSVADRQRLEILVDGGSAAAHRGWAPTIQDVKSMVDILEQFIHDAIVLPQRRKKLDAGAIKLKALIPPRK